MFKELFYWAYRFIKRNKSNQNPELNAFFLITMLEGINIATIWGFFCHYFGLVIPQSSVSSIFMSISIILLTLNYFLLYKKANEISKKIELLSLKRKRSGKILFVIYNLLTFLLMIYVGYYFIE